MFPEIIITKKKPKIPSHLHSLAEERDMNVPAAVRDRDAQMHLGAADLECLGCSAPARAGHSSRFAIACRCRRAGPGTGREGGDRSLPGVAGDLQLGWHTGLRLSKLCPRASVGFEGSVEFRNAARCTKIMTRCWVTLRSSTSLFAWSGYQGKRDPHTRVPVRIPVYRPDIIQML